MRTLVAIYKCRINYSNAKKRPLKLGTFLTNLAPNNYLGPYKVFGIVIYLKKLSMVMLAKNNLVSWFFLLH